MEKIYIFNTFFYKKISGGGQFQDSIIKWTGEINIFEKDYLIIPINEALHWILAIVCFPRDCLKAQNSSDSPSRSVILIFDSLNGSYTSRSTKYIRQYVFLSFLPSSSLLPPLLPFCFPYLSFPLFFPLFLLSISLFFLPSLVFLLHSCRSCFHSPKEGRMSKLVLSLRIPEDFLIDNLRALPKVPVYGVETSEYER